MDVIKKAQLACSTLQDHVIGLFRIYGTTTIELVIENNDGHLKTVHIGNLGGISTLSIPQDKGNLIMFDEGTTLTDFLSNPFLLKEITDKFKSK